MSSFVSTYDGRAEIEVMEFRALRRARVAPVSNVTSSMQATEDTIKKEMELRLFQRLGFDPMVLTRA